MCTKQGSVKALCTASLIAAVLAGCDRADGAGSTTSPDALVTPDTANVPSVCPAPSTGTHRIFLAFDGVTLTQASVSNAAQNQVVFGRVTSGTVGAWNPFGADRRDQ